MKTIKFVAVLLSCVYLEGFAFFQEDSYEKANKNIVSSLNSGDASELSRYFNEMIDLSISGTEENYSKTQATRILRDFFQKYRVSEFKISREGTSNDGSHFVIGFLKAGDRQFRIYYLLKMVNGTFLIQQFQVKE